MNRRLHPTTSGVVLATAPIPPAIAAWSYGGSLSLAPAWAQVLASAAMVFLVAGALTLGRRSEFGRTFVSLGVVSSLAVGVPGAWTSPRLAVALVLVGAFSLAALWRLGAPVFWTLSRGSPLTGRVRGSAATAFTFWLTVALAGPEVSLEIWSAVGVSLAIAAGSGGVWALRRLGEGDPRARVLLGALALTAVLIGWTIDDLRSVVSSGAFYALVATAAGPRIEEGREPPERWWAAVLEHPERLLVTTFATLAALGAVVLALPQSSTSGVSMGGLDAVFTAVSAVCVTGLIVRDTAVELSALGQAAILILIQLGGLGIMTFSTAALRVLGGRMSFRQESAVARLIGTRDRSRLIASAQDVLRVTFAVEALGTVALTALFRLAGDPLGVAVWRGLFTSISAYCNAGFALQTDSLMPYAASPAVLHVVAVLIVLGGLSPVVVLALAARARESRRFSIHVRICLLAAVVLLVGGFGFYALVEWNGTLAGLSAVDKLHNAWFQSVTLRTAGFNSVDVAAVHPATYVMMLCLMFVGASPGGTAGGVKTTTIAVLGLAALHTIAGSAAVTVMGRRIPETTVRRASVVVLIAVLFAVLATAALLLTQNIATERAVFEIISALGTVGLSQGATAELDGVGRVIVVVCMFVGRIGGLSVMMFMGQRTAGERVVLPVEDLDVG